MLYSSTNNVFFLWSLQHSDLGWSVCLPTTICCLLVCRCMLRAGRVDVKGWSSCRQVRRGCMVSAGRSVFWCPLMGAENDLCGRNGRWKGLIFRHNRVHVLNQGAVLKKSSLRGVHPGDFRSRQGENERQPISCAHSSWTKRITLLCRKMTRVHPVVSFPPKKIYTPQVLLKLLEKCTGWSRGPRGACGKLEHGKHVDGSSVRMCFACGRPKDDATAASSRPSHRGLLEMGRIGRG